MKFPPAATYASSTSNDAVSSAVQPNTFPPRQRGNTSRSLRPSLTTAGQPTRGDLKRRSAVIYAVSRLVGVRAGPRLVLILGGLSAFGPLSMDMYLPGLPTLTRDLGASASTGQLTLTGCMLGIAAGQLFTGPLSDTLGRRRPLLAGLVGYIAAS